MARGRAVYLCGGDMRPAALRGSDCPNALHNWPLPSGYGDASDEADRRLRKRWTNRKCPDCGLYGWIPSGDVKGTTAEHWHPQTVEIPQRQAREAVESRG